MKKIEVLKINQFKDVTKTEGFYFNNFKDHFHIHQKAISIPHKHDFFLTVLFTKGSGIHEIDFNSYEIKPGSIFLLNPGQTHYWEPSEDTEGFVFFHSKDFFDIGFNKHSVFDFPFFSSLLNPSVLYLPPSNDERIKSYFQELQIEYAHENSFKKEKIIALLDLIYIELSRVYPHTLNNYVLKSNTITQHLRQLEQLVEEKYKTDKSPASYADMLNISARHLNRLTRESLGKTTTQLITERVILEAKRILVHNNDSLANIAYTLGYEDYAYFSHLFKKWTGFTPSEFTRKYKSSKTLS